MKKLILFFCLLFINIAQATSIGQAMNVSGQGSDYIFVYRGNNPNEFDALVGQGLTNLSGWIASCNTCTVTTLVIDHATQPDADYLFLYTANDDGTVAYPESGQLYSFDSPQVNPVNNGSDGTISVTGSSTTTGNDFSSTLVNDVTFSGNSVNSYDSMVYGSSYTVNNTTNYSDGSSTTVSSTDYDVWKVYQIPAWNYSIPAVSGNSVYLNQTGINPTVNIEQVGARNAIAGINNQNAVLAGNNNTLTVRQAGEDNLTLVKVNGNSNYILIPQGFHHNWNSGAESATTGSNNNRAMVSVFGDSNNIFIPQEGLNNLTTSTIVGSGNQNTIVQYGNDNKSYNYINGNGNILNNWQQGNGNLSLINLYGNSNQASVTQTGNNNSSTINLTNAGGANNITVTQSNSTNTTGNNFMLNQTCYLAAGCNVTVTQSK